MPLDRALLEWVSEHRTAWATALARALMAVGTRPVPVLGVALLALATVAVLRAWRPATAAVLAGVVAVVVTEVTKHLTHRPRPPATVALIRTAGWSMPSTDAAFTAATTTALALGALAGGRWAGRLVAAALVAATVAVGMALVYLGAHWPTDVLVGWLLGGFAGWACTVLLRPRGSRTASPAT